MKETISKVRQYLLEVFDIKDGELGKALMMQSIIFLLIATLLIVKPTVNSLFLSRFGVESLPKAFLLVALVAAGISTLYSRLLGRFSLLKIFLGIQYFSIASLLIFGVLLRLNFLEGWILYLFYVWMAIFGILSASQFWIMANIVFNAREAKRLFGFIGSGAIAGGIFGGYLTSILAEAIGSENLLFVAGFLLSLCIPLTSHTWHRFVLTVQTDYQQKKRLSGFTKHPFHIIRHSKHLSFMAGIIGISVIVAKLVEYQFSAVASEKIGNPDDLTAFFGFWYSNFNLISLLIQLFLTRRIIESLGVGKSLFVLPGAIGFGALIIVFFPELWAAIFIRMSDGSLKQSINKAAIELLALPIPVEVKNQTKTFIDVFIDSAATGISGIILMFVISGLDLPLFWVALINILMVGIWIYFAFKIQGEYINSFKLKLGWKKREQNFFLKNKKEDLEKVANLLEYGTDREILTILDQLKVFPHKKLLLPTLKCLGHPNSVIRANTIKTLYFFKNPSIADRIKAMTSDPAQRVKIEAFEYLMLHHSGNLENLMKIYWSDDNPRVRGAALVSMARESRNNPHLQSIFDIQIKINQTIEKIPTLVSPSDQKFKTISALKAIGYSQAENFYSFLETHLQDENLEIRKAAILSAGNTLEPRFLPQLFNLMDQKESIDTAVKAISFYGPGIIDTLRSYLDDDSFRTRHQFRVPQIISHIGHQNSIEFLLELFVQSDSKMRLAILKALNRLKRGFPYLNFHTKAVLDYIHEEAKYYQYLLGVIIYNTEETSAIPENFKQDLATLQKILEARLDENLERIFRLLGLRYVPDEILSLYKSLQSGKKDLRNNALEYLENILETPLKKILIPIIESSMLENISEEWVEKRVPQVPELKDCLLKLTESKDKEIAEWSKKIYNRMKRKI